MTPTPFDYIQVQRELADAQAEIRHLKHKLALSNGDAARLEMALALLDTQTATMGQLMEQTAGAADLQAALVAWRETYSDWEAPDFTDHYFHSRSVFSDRCPGCVAEFNLLAMAGKMDQGERGNAAAGTVSVAAATTRIHPTGYLSLSRVQFPARAYYFSFGGRPVLRTA